MENQQNLEINPDSDLKSERNTKQTLCMDLIIECITFLPVKEIIKIRQVSKQWKNLVDYHPWDFKNQNITIYYRTIFEKRFDWFKWLNRNNIDPNFSRTRNMIAFSIFYSSPHIVKWFIDHDYPLSLSTQMLELKAIRHSRNSFKISILNNYLKKKIKDGEIEYRKWLTTLSDPAFLFEKDEI
jgi:hypothetical protein